MRNKPMELLAPAGDPPCLEAAIEAGADAVYFGLSLLNARRGAKNFTSADLESAVRKCSDHQVATHLTLNIDIAGREIGAAARMLSLARDVGVTAVIARDWAVVGLWKVMADAAARDNSYCPALHLSTQTAVTNAEGALLARDLGASRVVLARELSLAEIRTLTAVPGIEIEVFAQGALCYAISGRCLMSSWGGGRSGNRGLCVSPCRVPWAVNGETVGTAMSMRDLVTVDRLRELAEAGVDALKIEGRLKKPEWVKEAVSLYRQALGSRDRTERLPERPRPDTIVRARKLAEYAGRDVTSSYLDGDYSGLTGVAARKSSPALQDFLNQTGGSSAESETRVIEKRKHGETYDLEITIMDKGISCRCTFRDRSHSWRMPKTRIKREKKATSLEQLFASLKDGAIGPAKLGEYYTNEPDFQLPPRNIKAVLAAVTNFVTRLANPDNDADALLKAPLPAEMRAALAAPDRDPANCRSLGERPNQVRVSLKQLNSTLLPILRDVRIVLQNAGLADMDFAAKFVDLDQITVSFPEVYFPGDSEKAEALARFCLENRIRAEVNCWGSLWLCRKYGVPFVGGPGLPVLNHLAVKCQRDLGAQAATISMEADRQQIEDVSAASALPLTLIIFARPILAHTRIPGELLLPETGAAPGNTWTDRRGINLRPETGMTTTFFRSLTAFDWHTLTNPDIKVANLCLDLSGESYPVEIWKKFTRPTPGGGKPGFLFNYDRGLK